MRIICVHQRVSAVLILWQNFFLHFYIPIIKNITPLVLPSHLPGHEKTALTSRLGGFQHSVIHKFRIRFYDRLSSFIRWANMPPTRPHSARVRDSQPSCSTLSSKPSSAAISIFNFSRGVSSAGFFFLRLDDFLVIKIHLHHPGCLK